MPTWRKLHQKITQSDDVNEMPDDFTRLLWTWLPLALDREGRGIDNPAWIRSKVFPLREDITTDQIRQAMTWYEQRGMITRYKVGNRALFTAPTFREYQGECAKEAESILPPPPDPVQSNAGPTPDLVQDPLATDRGVSKPLDVDVDVDVDIDSDTDTEAEAEGEKAPPTPAEPEIVGSLIPLSEAVAKALGVPEYTGGAAAWNEGLKIMQDAGVLPEDIPTAVAELRGSNKKYTLVGARSIAAAAISIAGRRNGVQPAPQNNPHKSEKSPMQIAQELIARQQLQARGAAA